MFAAAVGEFPQEPEEFSARRPEFASCRGEFPSSLGEFSRRGAEFRRAGETLLVYTDGWPEATAADVEEFGIGRAAASLRRAAKLPP